MDTDVLVRMDVIGHWTHRSPFGERRALSVTRVMGSQKERRRFWPLHYFFLTLFCSTVLVRKSFSRAAYAYYYWGWSGHLLMSKNFGLSRFMPRSHHRLDRGIPIPGVLLPYQNLVQCAMLFTSLGARGRVETGANRAMEMVSFHN